MKLNKAKGLNTYIPAVSFIDFQEKEEYLEVNIDSWELLPNASGEVVTTKYKKNTILLRRKLTDDLEARKSNIK